MVGEMRCGGRVYVVIPPELGLCMEVTLDSKP